MSFDFDSIYDAYAPMVYRIGVLYLDDCAAAEDLVQDVFVKLFTYKGAFQDGGHLKGWLVTVARNNCRNITKRNSRFVPLSDDLPYCDKTDSVMPELYKLSAKDRLVIYLRYYEGYTSAEIARLTGGTDMAVRTRLKRARAALKEILTEE